MQSETAKVTTAQESAFRVQKPNSKARAAKIIALDPASAGLVDELARKSWGGARFFTALSFSADEGPAPHVGGKADGLRAWLKDIAGRTMDLVAEVESSDFVVAVTTAGTDARAIRTVADACALHHKSLFGLVLPGEAGDEAATLDSVKHLRPYARMLVIAKDADYAEAMLQALRA